jgi:hypothetical protein
MLKRAMAVCVQRRGWRARRNALAIGLTLVALLGLSGCVPTDVRNVKWASATYSVNCPGGSGTRTVQATLRNGFAHVAGTPFTKPPIPNFHDGWDIRLVSSSVGDIANDRTFEAVVRLSCYVVGSANMISQDVQVLTTGPKLIHRVALYNQYNSPYFQPAIDKAIISGGKITGTAYYWNATDPHCCPSHHQPYIVGYDPHLHQWYQEQAVPNW